MSDRPTAATGTFPYPHRTMEQVKRDEFYSLLDIGWPVSTAAKRARMTQEQAEAAVAAREAVAA